MKKEVKLMVAGGFGLAIVLGILAFKYYFQSTVSEEEDTDHHRNFYDGGYDNDGGYEFQALL